MLEGASLAFPVLLPYANRLQSIKVPRPRMDYKLYLFLFIKSSEVIHGRGFTQVSQELIIVAAIYMV
jgi:hypothetical protein